jgi:hypothetical protein
MKASAQQVELSALFADLEITSLAPSVAVVPGLACDVMIQLGDDYLQMI